VETVRTIYENPLTALERQKPVSGEAQTDSFPLVNKQETDKRIEITSGLSAGSNYP